LALPISWKGTLAQYAGRLHRIREGKHMVTIYDYADLDVPMLRRMFQRRLGGYKHLGYKMDETFNDSGE
jgi:superfamily II DNA or RNA helicase